MKRAPDRRRPARERVVFPHPGPPSSSRLPSANMQIAAVRTASSFPAMTLATFSVSRWSAAEASPKAGLGSITVRGFTTRPTEAPERARLHAPASRRGPAIQLPSRRRCARIAVISDVSYGRGYLDDVHPSQLDRAHDLPDRAKQLAREQPPASGVSRCPAPSRIDDVDVHRQVRCGRARRAPRAIASAITASAPRSSISDHRVPAEPLLPHPRRSVSRSGQ